MELLVFLIPFFVSAVLLLFFRKQTTWWEHAVLIVPLAPCGRSDYMGV